MIKSKLNKNINIYLFKNNNINIKKNFLNFFSINKPKLKLPVL